MSTMEFVKLAEDVTNEELKKDSIYVIYMGLPMRLYQNADVPVLWGFWSWVPVVFAVEPILGFDSWGFKPYSKGKYIQSLWSFLFPPQVEQK